MVISLGIIIKMYIDLQHKYENVLVSMENEKKENIIYLKKVSIHLYIVF